MLFLNAVKPKEDNTAAEQQTFMSYDELRLKNRQEYEKSSASSRSPFRHRPLPPPSTHAPSGPSAQSDHSESSSSDLASGSQWDLPQTAPSKGGFKNI